MVDDAVRPLTLQKADAGDDPQRRGRRGMVTLRIDGARKVMQGMTTPEEVLHGHRGERATSMPLYAYKGIGAERQGGQRRARRRLAQGAAPAPAQGRRRRHQVDLSKGGKKAGRRGQGPVASEVDFGGVFERVKKTEVAAFTRQLATLLKAGIPLAEALGALFDQAENVALKARARRGRGPRSTRAPRSPTRSPSTRKVFDELFISMVRAGETAGNLDEVLIRLADFMESAAEAASRKVKGAMVYPVIMMVVGVGSCRS